MTLAAEYPSVSSPEPPDELAHIRRRLHEDFRELPTDTIDHCFAAELATFEGCRITAFVPILIEKNVRQRLRAVQRMRSAG